MIAQAFLAGAAAMAAFVIGLKFFKYWRLSRDPLFVWFAAAFWTFAAGWGTRTAMLELTERAYLLYVPRLLGFVMILIGILAKNRKPAD